MPSTPWDTIPDFGANPTLWSVRNGQWHDSGMWSGGYVPTPSDVVVYDHQVVNHGLAEAKTVQGNPGGILLFNPDVPTSLTVNNLLVLAESKMTVGTAGFPVNASASIIFRDAPLDPVADPGQYGGGMIVLGDFAACGLLERTPYVRLETELLANTQTLILETQALNWQVGDKLIIADSRQLRFPGPNGVSWCEPVTIAAINPSGLVVTLAAPTIYHHKGWKNAFGIVENRPHVFNVTRNVTLKSQNMNGVRGHTMYTHRANVDIRRCKFGGLGRTANVGPTVEGRYPAHFHHEMGPVMPQANGYQYTFEDNVVTCSLDPMPWRWGVVLHDSHYGKVTGNVVYNAAGAGIVCEEGGETRNRIEDNLVCRVAGTGDRETRGAAGDAIWLAGQGNYVNRNVACGIQWKATAATAESYGYDLDCRTVPADAMVRVPSWQGADTSVTGEYTLKRPREIPILEFDGNEVYCAPSGATVWHVGADPTTVVPNVQLSVIANFTAWHVSQYGIWFYQNAETTVLNPSLRGEFTTIPGVTGSTGIFGADYLHGNFRVVSGDIQGFGTGWNPSMRVALNTEQVMEGTTVRCLQNVVMNTLKVNNADILPLLQPRICRTRGVLNLAVPGKPLKSIVMAYTAAPTTHQIMSDRLLVEDYNGVAGDDFEVFRPTQQAPGFICPKTATTTPPNVIGHSGGNVVLTNAQTWATFGEAVCGQVEPAGTTTRPEIVGKLKAT